jgi:molybdopterin-guanine dinucleotide biosynthesis protein A
MLATTYKSPHDNLPEPLITIWEPKSYPVLLSFLADGYSCPRKVLRNSEIKMIDVTNHDVLLNVNTEADLLRVNEILEKETR